VRKCRQRKTISVAAVQPAMVEEIDAQRLARVERLLAGVEKADMVLLPELWRVGYSNFPAYSKKAETIDGGTVSFLSGAAKHLGAYLLGGSIVERRGETLHNTAVLFDPTGERIEVYRKIHLLSYHSQERDLLTAGRQITVMETEIGHLGLAICYDLRFPELFREMSKDSAEVFLIPAAWPAVRAEAWESLCRARAVENQAFVIACNATGRGLLGRSMIVDPWGVKRPPLSEVKKGYCAPISILRHSESSGRSSPRGGNADHSRITPTYTSAISLKFHLPSGSFALSHSLAMR